MPFDDLERILRSRDDVVIGCGISELALRTAEEELELTFPLQLCDYLMQFGHLELGHFELFGLGYSVPEYLDLVRMTLSERMDSGCPLRKDLIPLLNDGGGNLYCITAGRKQTGAIILWDHAAGPDQEPDAHAPTFQEWMIQLLEELDQE